MKKYFVLFAAVVLTIFVTSCAKAPQAEMDAAQAALDSAKVAQVDVFMESEYAALQDSINAAATEIQAQKSKVFGNYKSAQKKLIDVTASANDLITKTEARKVEVKTEIATAQAEIATLMDENAKMVEMAPKGKEGKEAIESIKSDLASINASTPEVQTLVDGNQLMAAQTKVNAVKQKATEINTELKTVLEKYMKRK